MSLKIGDLGFFGPVCESVKRTFIFGTFSEEDRVEGVLEELMGEGGQGGCRNPTR